MVLIVDYLNRAVQFLYIRLTILGYFVTAKEQPAMSRLQC